MTTQIQLFTAPTGAQLRTVDINGSPYFVGKDVAEALGYSDPFGAIKKHVDSEDKQNCQNDSFESPRGMTVINESGLYSLILASHLPAAKQFKRWVTAEVLPAIHRQGGYMVDLANETPEETMARALKIAAATIERQQSRIDALEAHNNLQARELAAADTTIKQQHLQLAQAAPKILFADAVSQSDTCILVGELAKLMRQNGLNIGQNRLYDRLRSMGLIMQNSTRPTQRGMDSGYFQLIERTVITPGGKPRLTITTKVTGKGQQYLLNLFLPNK